MNETLYIRRPCDISLLLNKYHSKRQEHFIVITLNGAHGVIKKHLVTVGLANKTIVHPREVYWWAIKDNACAVVFAHNHPTGLVEPSPEDIELTKRLHMAGAVLGFHVLDHIILSRGRYFSFRENDYLSKDYDAGFTDKIIFSETGGIK